MPKAVAETALRVLCRARSIDDRPGEIRFGTGASRAPSGDGDHDSRGLVPKSAPELDARTAATLFVPPGASADGGLRDAARDGEGSSRPIRRLRRLRDAERRGLGVRGRSARGRAAAASAGAVDARRARGSNPSNPP